MSRGLSTWVSASAVAIAAVACGSSSTTAGTPHAPFASASSHAPIACPPNDVVALDLAAWKRSLSTAKDAASRNALLAELHLDAVSDPTSEQASSCTDPPSFVDATVREVELDGDARTDRVVDVTYDGVCAGGDAKSETSFGPGAGQRVAVLLAIDGDRWCALAAPPSLPFAIDQANDMRACLGPDQPDPLVFSFEPLISAGANAIRVVSESGACGTCGRIGHYETSFLVVDGAALRVVFSAVTYDASYSGCPTPPLREDSAEVKVVGSTFPRSIELTERTVCNHYDGVADDPECKESTKTSTLRLAGLAYAKP
jgi:hypothetical protein